MLTVSLFVVPFFSVVQVTVFTLNIRLKLLIEAGSIFTLNIIGRECPLEISPELLTMENSKPGPLAAVPRKVVNIGHNILIVCRHSSI